MIMFAMVMVTLMVIVLVAKLMIVICENDSDDSDDTSDAVVRTAIRAMVVMRKQKGQDELQDFTNGNRMQQEQVQHEHHGELLEPSKGTATICHKRPTNRCIAAVRRMYSHE